MKRIGIRLFLISLLSAMLSFSAYAADYLLKSSKANGMDNRSHGTYSSYPECTEAAKSAKKSNPDRYYWCTKK